MTRTEAGGALLHPDAAGALRGGELSLKHEAAAKQPGQALTPALARAVAAAGKQLQLDAEAVGKQNPVQAAEKVTGGGRSIGGAWVERRMVAGAHERGP